MRDMLAHYEGRVVSRDDPEGLGRVKVFIPNLFDAPTYSGWIRPWGLFDATEGRGFFIVPKVGANVIVVFLYGDALEAKFARYMCGPWGRPQGVSDVPTEAVGPAGVPDANISVMAFDGFAIVVDERDTFRKATFIDRVNGSKIVFDIENKNVELTTILDFAKTIGQNESSTITGNRSASISGDDADTVTGKAEVTADSRKVTTVKDDERVVGGDWKVTVQGAAQIQSVGNAEITAQEDVVVNAGVAKKLELNVGAQTALKTEGSTPNTLIDGTSEVKIGRLASEGLLKASAKASHDTHTHTVMISGVPVPTSVPVIPMPNTVVTTKVKGE